MGANDIGHAHLTAEFLRGVRPAAEYAHDAYDDPMRDEIIDGTVAAAVRAEAGL